MPLISDEAIAKIKTNVEIALKSYSTYVVAAILWLAGKWMGMDDAEHAALIARFPILIPYAVPLAAILTAAARVAPQWLTLNAEKQARAEAQLQAALDEAKTLREALSAAHAAPAAEASSSAPSQPEFADTQVVDIPIEPPPAPAPAPAPLAAIPPAALAAAQLLVRTQGLMAVNRMLAPELTDEQIRSELAKPPAPPLGSITVVHTPA